jgi:hypothetical protein
VRSSSSRIISTGHQHIHHLHHVKWKDELHLIFLLLVGDWFKEMKWVFLFQPSNKLSALEKGGLVSYLHQIQMGLFVPSVPLTSLSVYK